MSGDGMDGMALAILISMALIVIAGFAVLFVIGWLFGRWRGWNARKRRMSGLGAGLFGIVLGLLAVTATFFESSFSPPPEVLFNSQPGFEHEWVILLEDPQATSAIRWSGVEAPFKGKKTRINVVPSGVIRVRSLDGISGRGDLKILWSDGSQSNGMASGPAPKATGARLYSAFNRAAPGATGPNIEGEPPFGDNDAMAEYITARENPSADVR